MQRTAGSFWACLLYSPFPSYHFLFCALYISPRSVAISLYFLLLPDSPNRIMFCGPSCFNRSCFPANQSNYCIFKRSSLLYMGRLLSRHLGTDRRVGKNLNVSDFPRQALRIHTCHDNDWFPEQILLHDCFNISMSYYILVTYHLPGRCQTNPYTLLMILAFLI